MINHENGHSSLTYFTINSIPISSKVSKYKSIIDKKIIYIIARFLSSIRKYIDYLHIVDGKQLKVIDTLKKIR